MMKIIYLDNHATTPMDPRVLKAMMPYLSGSFGNPASFTHALGRDAAKAVEHSRMEVARLIGAGVNEIIFTSGATESDNLAIKGVAEAYKDKGRHFITVATEHKAVLDPMKRLSLEGNEVTVLKVRKDGLVDLKELERAIRPHTVMISVMMANNEIGVIQPIAKIARLAKSRGVLFHTDAAQAAGKIAIDVQKMGIDLLSFSAHKMYGPKGVGALYIRKSGQPVRLTPLSDGGGQEGGFRSGTLNVSGIVGLGEACRLARLLMKAESRRLAKRRDVLKLGLTRAVPGAYVHGSLKDRLPNNLNICLPGVNARKLMQKLAGIALSAGSACLSTSPEPSYVLKALGVKQADRYCSIRFGLGRFNTQTDIDKTIRAVTKAV